MRSFVHHCEPLMLQKRTGHLTQILVFLGATALILAPLQMGVYRL